MTSETRGDNQTAYEVIVASSAGQLSRNLGDRWDSGKVATDESVQVGYAGKPFDSDTTYYWKVRIWNALGQPSPWSDPSMLSTGLYQAADWKGADWIAWHPDEQWRAEWDQHKKDELKNQQQTFPWRTGTGLTIFEDFAAASPPYDPAPLFRKEFQVKSPVRKATLYICGLGYYEAFINGNRVGDHVLDPAWTTFQKRSLYVTYDLTDKLKPGANALGVMLGRGEYAPLCNDNWGLRNAEWIDEPKLIARLSITYADGSQADLTTDDTWRVAGGPIVYDDGRYGELYDARREQPGWAEAAFDDKTWMPVAKINWDAQLQAQSIPPIRAFAPLQPVRQTDGAQGVKRFEFAQNIAGWARVKISGPTGTHVLVDYVETPGDQLPRQQNGYILKGEGQESFECHFSYKGFQFVQIKADPGVQVMQVEAVPVHTDVVTVGNFTCSNPLLNRLQHNAAQSFLNNFHGIPTDCPHREKLGWTADAYLSAQAAFYNFDMAAFHAKWITDFADSQTDDGSLGTIAPSSQHYNPGLSPTWAAAIVVLPWDLWNFYSDRRTLENYQDSMTRFAKNIEKRHVPGKPDILYDQLGDWLSPVPWTNKEGLSYVTSPPEGRSLYGTAAYFRIVHLLAEIQDELGNVDEAAADHAWADRIAAAFNREFFDPSTDTYHGENPVGYRQSANAVPLAYGITTKDVFPEVVNNLVKDVHVTQGDRLSTGFLGTPAVLDVLAEQDPEEAYAVATQTRFPSWGYAIETGNATTMWESWGGDASHDHAMPGLISAYFYKHLAGIAGGRPGFKEIVIRPSVVGDLTWVKAEYDSIRGPVVSNWQREGNKLEMDVTIPANSTATVYVPARDSGMITESGMPAVQAKAVRFLGSKNGEVLYQVGSGTYRFKSELK